MIFSRHAVGKPRTLEAAFKEFSATKLRTRADGTRLHYSRMVQRFIDWLQLESKSQGKPSPSDCTNVMIASYLDSYANTKMRNGQYPAPETVNSHRKNLVSFFRWMAKKGWCEWPEVEKMPCPETEPDAWTLEELKMIWLACRKQKGRVGDAPAAVYWEAVHEWLLQTGERSGATFKLEQGWINFEAGFVRVPGRVRKGGKAITYWLSPALLHMLKKLPNSEFVFDRGINRATWYLRYQQLIEDAGLVYVPRRTGPQKIRRTFATLYEVAGGNATEALLHNDRNTTRQSYLDKSAMKPQPAFAMLPNMRDLLSSEEG